MRDTCSYTHRDLEQVRQTQATQHPDSEALESQSQAMLNLQLKLQSSVLKGQVKTIELELRKLDTLQAVSRLEILRVSWLNIWIGLLQSADLACTAVYPPHLFRGR